MKSWAPKKRWLKKELGSNPIVLQNKLGSKKSWAQKELYPNTLN